MTDEVTDTIDTQDAEKLLQRAALTLLNLAQRAARRANNPPVAVNLVRVRPPAPGPAIGDGELAYHLGVVFTPLYKPTMALFTIEAALNVPDGGNLTEGQPVFYANIAGTPGIGVPVQDAQAAVATAMVALQDPVEAGHA